LVHFIHVTQSSEIVCPPKHAQAALVTPPLLTRF